MVPPPRLGGSTAVRLQDLVSSEQGREAAHSSQAHLHISRHDLASRSLSSLSAALPDETDDDDENLMRSAPRDSLGSRRKISTHAMPPEQVFMAYVRPLIEKVGTKKTEDALSLAQGIWNATITGANDLRKLRESVSNQKALASLVEMMIRRKINHFPDEQWLIDNLHMSSFDAAGRFSLRFDTIE